MPLLLEEKKEHLTVLVWKIEEEKAWFWEQIQPFLATDDAEMLQNIQHPEKQLESIAGRYLLLWATGFRHQIIKNEIGKLIIKDKNTHLSVSHSHGLVAAIISQRSRVGVDIQLITEKIERLAPKFMHEGEIKSISKSTIQEHLHVYWGAKEALFKAFGKPAIDWKMHLQVSPFELDYSQGKAHAKVQKEGFETEYYTLYYQKILDHYILVYADEIIL